MLPGKSGLAIQEVFLDLFIITAWANGKTTSDGLHRRNPFDILGLGFAGWLGGFQNPEQHLLRQLVACLSKGFDHSR